MVGKPNRKDDRVVCNLWGCEVQHTEQTKLQQCIKCKEVLYCSRAHQASPTEHDRLPLTIRAVLGLACAQMRVREENLNATDKPLPKIRIIPSS